MPPGEDTRDDEHSRQETYNCPQHLNALAKRSTKVKPNDPRDGIVNGQ